MSKLTDTARAGPTMVGVDAAHEGQRIDNFLLAALKGVPKSHVYRLLRTGQVRVNKGRIKPIYRLRAGDVVRIPPLALGAAAPAAAPAAALCQRLREAVLYEDAELLVLDKPAGLSVHGGSGVRIGVIEALKVVYPRHPDITLVHRLDRATSGCLLVAKERRVLPRLHALFREGGVEKRYLALLRGGWRGGARVVDVALHKNRLRGGERMVEVDAAGKPSATRFVPRAVYARASLMEIGLATGRTHQIRVHSAHIGHPVAGDEKYGDPIFNREMRAFGLKRLFLHAEALAFAHPVSGKRIAVRAPLDEGLRSVLKHLEGD